MEDETGMLPASLMQSFRGLSSTSLSEMGWKEIEINRQKDLPNPKLMEMSVEEFNESLENNKFDKKALQEVQKYLGDAYSKTDTDLVLDALRAQILSKTKTALDALQKKEQDIENKMKEQEKIEESRRKEKAKEIECKLEAIAIADKTGEPLKARPENYKDEDLKEK
ncbi:hypothetical protein RLOatenuis_4710 [Rickettsiales bacterium]|nr:hypothetical protein RLOatenuis_4710 [Rickettsiales bacterium]